MNKIQLKKIHPDAEVPEYGSSGAAAVDLRVMLAPPECSSLTIPPGMVMTFNTGIAVHIKDPSIAMQIIPRSGSGSNGLVLGNLVGLIDSDYQGEIKVTLWNRRKDQEVTIEHGQRVAQAIFVPVIKVQFDVVEEFSETTARGNRGFGSTGMH